MPHPDVCIAGAGVIGISLALELARRGASVTVVDRGPALGESSSAAAGMLAAADPANAPLLRPLSDLSLSLYPEYLDHIARLSDIRVPFQTELTLEVTALPTTTSLSRANLDIFLPVHHLADAHVSLLDEHSIDPRQLASALLGAAANTSIKLLTNTPILRVDHTGLDLTVRTPTDFFTPDYFVDCTGAWAATLPDAVLPRKGQMLSVALPQSSPLSLVVRTDDLYIVPRTTGPNAGRAIIGATVEDAGFDKTVHPLAIAELYDRAVGLLPSLAGSRILEQWAGLRPATADGLPILGSLPGSPRHLFATGHFRNGILLAPATGRILAQIIHRERLALDLAPFLPARFEPVAAL